MPHHDYQSARQFGFGYGFPPLGFGFPLGFIGGLAAGALVRPRIYPIYRPFPFYGGFWW